MFLDSKLGTISPVLVFASPKKQVYFSLFFTSGSAVSKDHVHIPLLFVQMNLNLKLPAHPTNEAGMAHRLSKSGMATVHFHSPQLIRAWWEAATANHEGHL